jgi:hypothetical protein
LFGVTQQDKKSNQLLGRMADAHPRLGLIRIDAFDQALVDLRAGTN